MKSRRGGLRVGGVFYEFKLPGSSPQEQLNLGLAFLEWGPSSRLICADIAEHAQAKFSPQDPRKEKAIATALAAIRQAVKDYVEDPSNEIWFYLGKRNAYGLALKIDDLRDRWGNLILGDPPIAAQDADRALASAANMAAWYPWDTSYNSIQSASRFGEKDKEIEWQLQRLMDYLQFEAQEAKIAARSDARDLPELTGDPALIGLALIIRESAAKLLDITKVYNKKEREQKQQWLNNLKEKTSAAYWLRLHELATEVREDTQGWGRSFPWKKRTLLVAMDEVAANKEKIEGRPMRTNKKTRGLPFRVGAGPAPKATKEQIEIALQQTNQSPADAAKLLGIGYMTIYRLIKRYGIPLQGGKERATAATKKRWQEMSAEQREAESRSRAEMTQRRWDSKTEEERAAFAEEIRREYASRTPQEKEEHAEKARRHWESMTPEEKREHAEKTRRRFESMSPEQREAWNRALVKTGTEWLHQRDSDPELYQQWVEAVRQGWARMSPEDREAFKEKKREWFAQLSPSDQQKITAAIKRDQRARGAKGSIAGKRAKVGAYLPEIEIPGLDMSSKLNAGIWVLSAKSARRFAADCAEYVLPYWESKYPTNTIPRKAVEAARKCTDFSKQENIIRSSNDPMVEEGSRAYLAGQEIESFNSAASYAAKAAAYACSTPVARFLWWGSPKWERHSALNTIIATEWSWGYGNGYDANSIPPNNQAITWMYERLKVYLQLDAQDAMLRDHSEGIYPLGGKPEYIAFGTLVRRQTWEMLQLLNKIPLTEKQHRLIIDCTNELAAQDDAEYWAEARNSGAKRQRQIRDNVKYNISAMEVLIDESSDMDVPKILKSWRPYKPLPKRPKKEKPSGVKGIQLWQGGRLRALSTIGGTSSWDDPTTPPDELNELSKTDPRAFMNPNMSPDNLLEGAKIYPWYVEKNPVLTMLSLEDPGSYKRIYGAIIDGWRLSGVDKLSEENKRLLAADCAEHVIHVYERKYYKDKRLQGALDVIRRYAKGKATKQDLIDVNKTVHGMTESAADFQSARAAQSVEFAAYIPTDNVKSVYYVDKALEFAVGAVFSINWDNKDKEAEHLYQANRVRHYYAKTHPEYNINKDKVGSTSIWDDASLPPSELIKLAQKDPRVYQNPNLPWDTLLAGAMKYPWYVEHNPVLALLQLEDPEYYQRLEHRIRAGWRNAAVKSLSEKHRMMYAADCAERVLPIFQSQYPHDSRPKKALYFLRRYTMGQTTKEKLKTACQDVDGMDINSVSERPANALASVLCAAKSYAKSGASHAISASYFALEAVPDHTPEIVWQVERARYYYGLEHPEYVPPESIGGKTKFDDPAQDPDVLAKLSKRNHKTLLNPNLRWDALSDGARAHPMLAEQNPALVLLSIEDPAKFVALQNMIAGGWVQVVSKSLSEKNQRLFAADCAEHVLKNLESKLHPHGQASFAIYVARKLARGESSESDRASAKKAVIQSLKLLDRNSSEHYAATSAASTCAKTTKEALREAPWIAKYSAGYAASPNAVSDEWSNAAAAEQMWQANRVRHYYQEEHPEYVPPESIGGKKKFDDPNQEPEVLAKLSKKNPKTLMNPNLPWDSLIEGARRHPLIVEKNPALALLSLEDAAKFRVLQGAINSGWTSAVAKALSKKHQRLLAADCAEHVLQNIEADPTKYSYPEVAISVARRFANGEASDEERELATEAATQFAYTVPAGAASKAAFAASWACRPGNIMLVPNTLYRAAYSAGYAKGNDGSREWTEGYHNEVAWQADRVRYYYQLEHPEYQPPEQIGKVQRTSKLKKRKATR